MEGRIEKRIHEAQMQGMMMVRKKKRWTSNHLQYNTSEQGRIDE